MTAPSVPEAPFSPLVALPGGVPDAGRDTGVAAHYGDPMREQRTLAGAVGLVDRSHRGVLAVPGPERLTWLHSLTTQHLTALAPGEGTEALVLSPHGHVEHHAVLADDGTTSWLDTEPGAAPALLEFLASMRFLTRVEPRDATGDWAVLTLVGPEAADAVGTLGVAVLLTAPDVLAPPEPKFAAGTVPARPTAIYTGVALPDGGFARRTADDAVDLVVPRESLADVADRLRTAGVPACGIWAHEAIRVAARRPRFGAETDHRTIPHELGAGRSGWLATAVHLDKGCYRGQETVARVHHLGRAPRRLVLLHLDGTEEEAPVTGTPVTLEDRLVGFIGTALRHTELGMVALALVRRSVPADAQLRVAPMTAAIDPD